MFGILIQKYGTVASKILGHLGQIDLESTKLAEILASN